MKAKCVSMVYFNRQDEIPRDFEDIFCAGSFQNGKVDVGIYWNYHPHPPVTVGIKWVSHGSL